LEDNKYLFETPLFYLFFLNQQQMVVGGVCCPKNGMWGRMTAIGAPARKRRSKLAVSRPLASVPIASGGRSLQTRKPVYFFRMHNMGRTHFIQMHFVKTHFIQMHFVKTHLI
jgi:hypothetical protein